MSIFPEIMEDKDEHKSITLLNETFCQLLKGIVLEYEHHIAVLSSSTALQPLLSAEMLQAGVVSTIFRNVTALLVPILFRPRVLLEDKTHAWVIPQKYQFTSECYLGFILSSVSGDEVTVGRVSLLDKNLRYHPSFHNQGDSILCVPSALDISPKQKISSIVALARTIEKDLEVISHTSRGMFTPSYTPPEFMALAEYVENITEEGFLHLSPAGIYSVPRPVSAENVATEVTLTPTERIIHEL